MNRIVHKFLATFVVVLLSLVVSLAFLLTTGCTGMVSVNRNDPESVLRAYFYAWNLNDWALQASMMDDRYARMTPEPVESIRILELKLIPDSSSPDRTYQVSFKIKVKGRGVSMNDGQYDWTYYLSWNAQRGSWLITNYGAG